VGARFSATVQTGPGTHRASYAMRTGSIPEVKRPGRGVNHAPLSSAEVKERVELYLYSPSGALWPLLGRTYILPSGVVVVDRCAKIDVVRSTARSPPHRGDCVVQSGHGIQWVPRLAGHCLLQDIAYGHYVLLCCDAV
jgi:hypothetical protein